jgi:hypothetical protein
MPNGARLCNRTNPALRSGQMPATPDELFAYLDRLGIACKAAIDATVFRLD